MKNTINDIIKNKIKLYEDDNLLISFLNNSNSNNNILIIFSYRNEDKDKEPISYYLKKDANIIYIVDKKNSWSNNINFNKIKEKIQYIIKNKKIFLVGASMGGFNAILFSNYIDAEKCIAFVPQISINKNLAPDVFIEYQKDIEKINKIDVDTVTFNSKTKYVLFFGNDKQEKNSYLLAKKYKEANNFSNIDIFVFKSFNHDLLIEFNKILKVSMHITFLIESNNKIEIIKKYKNLKHLFGSFIYF
jgi:hypothetical protein